MVVNDTKIYQKMENKSYLSIEKLFQNEKKTPNYNYKKPLFLKVMILLIKNIKIFFEKFLLTYKKYFFRKNVRHFNLEARMSNFPK